MEQETTSAFDQLLAYAKEKGFEAESNRDEKRFLWTPSGAILNTKFIIFKVGDFVFFAYDSYGVKSGSSSTFSGLYASIDLPAEFECFMYRKDWADTFLRVHKRKIGLKAIDENITITSNSEIIPQGLISQKDAEMFVEFTKNISPIKLLIQNDYLQRIQHFKNKKIIGVEYDGWLYKKDELDLFIDSASKILTNILTHNK